MTKMKILIIRFSSIGDIILTTPVIRSLHKQLPDVEIHFCTKEEFKFLHETNPYISKVHTFSGQLPPLIKALRAEKFNYVIDLHHNLRTSIIKTFLGVKSASFNKLNLKKWLLVNFKIDLLPNVHIVDRYFGAVSSLGVVNDGMGLDYFIPDKYEVEKEWLPASHQKEFVAVVIGGRFRTKRLPVKRLIELCDKINKPVVLLGGAEDIEAAEEIERFFSRENTTEEIEDGLKELGKKTTIFNACGKFNFHQSASLVSQAKVVFTHDTGLMHVAAAFRKTIFSIWGNTIPRFGMYPYGTKFTVFENNKIGCRPCSKLGHTKCPKGHFKCMNDIVFDFYIP